jgi:hypothetical protein
VHILYARRPQPTGYNWCVRCLLLLAHERGSCAVSEVAGSATECEEAVRVANGQAPSAGGPSDPQTYIHDTHAH